MSLLKPLLTLVMIVRNEAHTIAKTLGSVRGVVDRYDILDTFSDDGTPDVIRVALDGIHGDVRSGPFENFASARNRSLAFAGDAAEYALLLDADDVLINGPRLREFLTSVRGHATDGGYFLPLAVTGCVFSSARVTRLSARWRFSGAVHELILPPGQDSYPADIRLISGVRIDHFPDDVGDAKTAARWNRDVKLLRGELERDPKNARAAFYLARTLSDLQLYAEAVAAFDVRIPLAGYMEEVFCSKLYKARCARLAGVPWDTCVGFWLEAHEQDPQRVEPLADLAAEYSARDDHARCVLFARRAFELPPPKEGALFVENHDYLLAHWIGWHAYYLPADHDLGMRACERAIKLRPEACAQDRENLRLYKRRT